MPEAAGRIHHVPHGAPDVVPGPRSRSCGQPSPSPIWPICHAPISAYIGSLEDRVDWELMDRISLTFPDASIVVVGTVRDPVDEPWWNACSRFSVAAQRARAGLAQQEDLAAYYQAFDVTLIPYRMDHPFNRACNPTKIMDSMGSGRPIVATAIPECRLHAERFDVAETATSSSTRSGGSSASSPTTAGPACGTRMPWPTPATGSASGFWT